MVLEAAADKHSHFVC